MSEFHPTSAAAAVLVKRNKKSEGRVHFGECVWTVLQLYMPTFTFRLPWSRPCKSMERKGGARLL